MAKKQGTEKQTLKLERFPAWLFHKDFGAVLFNAQSEVDAAGDGWSDSPAKIEKEEKRKFHKPLDQMTRVELVVLCRSLGFEEGEFQGKSQEEIIQLIQEKG